MANKTYVDEYTILTFNHNGSSAMIYIESPIDLKFFQIEMLENFFKRMLFYCESCTTIDINIQRLKHGDLYLIAYFNNKHQDYDFCGTFENMFMAIHNTLSSFFMLSINNEYPHASINDIDEHESGYYDDDEEEDENDDDDTADEDKNPESLYSHEIGLVIDEILKNTQLPDEQ